jgi:hypothetical protein
VEKPKKKWFLGRHLMLKQKYADKLLEGKKKATIRLGVVRVKYPELIVHSGGKPIAKVKVKSIKIKKVKELTDDDAIKDGFSTRDELLDELRHVYGRFSPDDPVTIIEFEEVERIESEGENPYSGLEPADIARIALKYLRDELSDEEREVLLDLTRTNSIRLTAVRLFGGIHRRHRVRRALRNALRLLKAKGIL